MDKETSEEIDILRGLAALGVIAGHTLYTKFIVFDGAFWVWIFFVASGFLQGHFFFSKRYELSADGIRRYYFNRFLRIFPLFIVIVMLGEAIHFLFAGSFNPFQTFKQLLCLTSDYYIGPLWSIACEVQFYLFVPIFIYLLSNKNLVWMGFLLTVASWIMWGHYPYDDYIQPRLILGNMPLFLTGIWAAYFYPMQFRINTALKFVIATLFILFILHIFKSLHPNFWSGIGVCVSTILTVFILLFHCRRTFIYDLLMPLRFVGKYCYGVYMYAALIGVLCNTLGHGQLGYKAMFLQLLSIPLAYVSYVYFEKIFLKLKKV